ncbi:hypothetical protein AKH00_16780 [Microbacterium sp. GCS4]|nr:hypothetical protein AKH00_16780 [Microbacterium sp. GCS4]
MNDFTGVRVAVFGGTGGIGAATVTTLLERGASVLSVGRSPGDTTVVGDVADDQSIAHALNEIERRLGGLDVLINAAGRGSSASFVDMSRSEWAELLDVNVIGMARTTALALPFLRRSECPSIVNVSSILAAVGVADRAAYSASKAAVASLTRSLAAELVPDGIRVNAVLPSTTETAWVQRLVSSAPEPEDAWNALVARQPSGKLVQPAEVAEAIAYLANPGAVSTTGVLLPVDGGVASIRR